MKSQRLSKDECSMCIQVVVHCSYKFKNIFKSTQSVGWSYKHIGGTSVHYIQSNSLSTLDVDLREKPTLVLRSAIGKRGEEI